MKVIIGVLYISSRGIFNCFTRVILDYHKQIEKQWADIKRVEGFLLNIEVCFPLTYLCELIINNSPTRQIVAFQQPMGQVKYCGFGAGFCGVDE